MASSNRGIQIGSAWFQRKMNLRPQHRGVHLVTEEILRQMPEICQFSVGLFHVQILHTSASLALNESWDPDMMLNKIVPEGLPYRHSCEGPDDMPAHVKACFLGSSLTIPITDGKLNLGTWQGIWLCEHRDQAGSRKLCACVQATTTTTLCRRLRRRGGGGGGGGGVTRQHAVSPTLSPSSTLAPHHHLFVVYTDRPRLPHRSGPKAWDVVAGDCLSGAASTAPAPAPTPQQHSAPCSAYIVCLLPLAIGCASHRALHTGCILDSSKL
ncbi:hypothetical protein LSTR_LSTR008295 [Laodelphax striatellus]|uniref:Secondary thiamine-phosphate synthase enzyme n=1 Tax=Laodelphax striatellus TaxID=195883 RepID=A0A482XKU8_LAOST|nr:hypothetical protein LSTR_LSTR008295 [Laodelphax striatellus]